MHLEMPDDTITNEGNLEAKATATATDVGVEVSLLLGGAVGNASTSPVAVAAGIRGGGGVDTIAGGRSAVRS